MKYGLRISRGTPLFSSIIPSLRLPAQRASSSARPEAAPGRRPSLRKKRYGSLTKLKFSPICLYPIISSSVCLSLFEEIYITNYTIRQHNYWLNFILTIFFWVLYINNLQYSAPISKLTIFGGFCKVLATSSFLPDDWLKEFSTGSFITESISKLVNIHDFSSLFFFWRRLYQYRLTDSVKNPSFCL